VIDCVAMDEMEFASTGVVIPRHLAMPCHDFMLFAKLSLCDSKKTLFILPLHICSCYCTPPHPRPSAIVTPSHITL